jgi:hypothetical protein
MDKNMNMQDRLGDAAWIWTGTCCMDINIQHGQQICTMDMDMDMEIKHAHGHGAWTWTCITDMDMQHGKRNVLYRKMDMHHGN